jgi:hypothetical protein
MDPKASRNHDDNSQHSQSPIIQRIIIIHGRNIVMEYQSVYPSARAKHPMCL